MARNPANLRLRWAGLGLTTYALSLATDVLNLYAPTPALFQLIARLHWPLLFFPSLFWLGAIIHLLPAESFLRLHLNRLWSYGLLPAAILFYLLSVVILVTGWPPLTTWGKWIIALVADVVAIFAGLQFYGLWRMSK
jgi:hypothetical protein